MSGLKCAEWVPAHAVSILEKEFGYWQNLWAWPLRVGPPTQDSMADLLSPENKHLREMKIWLRLANDEVMKDVYENLEAVPGFDEHQLADFLDAAWGARMGSLSEIRKGRARTRKLMPEIGEKALELKALIEQLDGSVPVPSELLSVVSLLRSAEEYQQTPWASSWQGGVGHSALDSIDPTIWDDAPTVPNLLQALAGAATDWKQSEQTGSHDPVEAALSGDKSNERTECLRALVAMLEERGLLVRTHVKPEMRRAIVGVARVVLEYTNGNDPTLFEDAMTRALNRLLGSD